MQATDDIQKSTQQEVKQQTKKSRIYPYTATVLGLVSVVLVEIDQDRFTGEVCI